MNQCDVQWIHLDPLHANRFDDGVAVNGCSDYSSSSSSGHSDITDPGSPFSVSSEDSSAAPSPARTTPPVSACPVLKQDVQSGGGGGGVGGGSWVWGGESELVQSVSPPPESLPAAPTTASKCNVKRSLDNNNISCSSNNNNNISTKKLKVEEATSTTATLCVQTAMACIDTKKECCVKTEDIIEASTVVQQTFEPDHRGKITHYYKPKKRPDEKRIPLLKAVTMGFTPFISSIIANNKGSINNMPITPPDKGMQVIKSEPMGRKMLDIKVNSTFKCPAVFDMNLKKGSSEMLAPLQLPDVVSKEQLQTKLDPDDKKMIAIAPLFKNGIITEKVKSELAISASPVKPITLCSRLDEKWIACSESPSSPKPSLQPAIASTPPVTPVPNESPTEASVSTPTKPVSNTTPVDRTVSSQSCLSIREQCIVAETRTGVTTDIVEKLSNTVMPEAVISTNGQTEPVSGQLIVNTSTTPSFLTPAPVGPKSPILSVPKSIRFPARSALKPEAGTQADDIVSCLWNGCSSRFDSDTTLLEHLQGEHVNTQKTDSFVCHWIGCKVYGRSSCSRSWLERHVLSHGGNKPFRCIVDGCGMRFSSQLMLERHVNWHFKQVETPSSNGSVPRRSFDTPPNKLQKRCGKKLRYRRQPWSARQFDYFDAGIMESLQYQLVLQAEQMALDRMPGSNVTLYSKVIAQRVQADGSLSVLLRWFPRNFAHDEWVPKKDLKSTRIIRLTEYHEDSLESSSSAGGSVYSTPPSSPASVISSPSASSSVESEDDGAASSTPAIWVLDAAAAVAAAAVSQTPHQTRKSRRKPLKKAAVT